LNYVPQNVFKILKPLVQTGSDHSNEFLTTKRVKKMKYWEDAETWEDIFSK
jgi:hypothetical protein